MQVNCEIMTAKYQREQHGIQGALLPTEYVKQVNRKDGSRCVVRFSGARLQPHSRARRQKLLGGMSMMGPAGG